MSAINESAARQILAEAGSPAADPVRYAAGELTGGWLFGWAGPGRPPRGARPWIVSDRAGVGTMRLDESPAEAVERLSR